MTTTTPVMARPAPPVTTVLGSRGVPGVLSALGVRSALGVLGALGVAATAVLARRALVSVTVRGRSMEPAYRDGDRVLVLRARRLSTGRVVVAERPGHGHVWPGPALSPGARATAVAERQWMIKRVGALPGEPHAPDLGESGEVPGHVPSGRLVLLGDNPQHSVDSRQLGYFPAERVLGVVLLTRPRARSAAPPSV
ncbi:S26 family signal peptidase [Streptomyces iconiensis]|uniref:S26 family signal peptidase n=1 Tax=Streptomyces iconiensis TaxID=1384038 RepID=A0ABT7A4S0_9ACTN|nr:S26 family signal peptidase [Streptomyces iconiensis]MDJ1136354.1 S26 family signal peptidase [Streptomyces iconiensis]